jgi:tetratricopeptide (TPR) repeat protein
VDVSARKPGGGFSFGSGYLIAPGLVLTVRHVVCADDGEPYDDVQIRFLADDAVVPSRLAWQGGLGLDAALLRCAPRAQPDAPVRWGQLIGSQPGVACKAAGFPRSMRQDDGLRDMEQMRGEISPGTGLLSGRVYVDIVGASPQPGDWDGMSGAALWCGPVLVGVVAYDPVAFASRRLAAEPAGRLAADPEFRAILGGNVIAEAAELARPGPRPGARGGPAHLLRAEARTARFRSRTAELARLDAWCQGPGVRIQLLTGPGGQGKTRLAQELTSRLGRVSAWLEEETRLPEGIRHPLLVIIDYAETRPKQVAEVILAALAEPGHVPIRVLLLARSAGDWWGRLRNQAAELEIGLTGATIHELAVLEDSPEGRRHAFTDALADYDAALTAVGWPHVAPDEVAGPEFTDPRLGSALQVQMTALAGLLGRDSPDESPEDVILRHESRYWTRTTGHHGLNLHEDTLRNAVAAVTLCGAASQPQAIELLTHVPGLRDQTEDARLRGARWLRDLYPPSAGLAEPAGPWAGHDRYWGSLQPDLLAEHLVAGVAEELPGFLAGLLSVTSITQDHQALTVLARASVSREHLASAVAGLLLRLPKLAVPAVDVVAQTENPGPLLAALNGLVMQGGLPTEALISISLAVPRSTQSLASLAITVQQMLIADYERLAEIAPGGYPPGMATAQAALAFRLINAGRPQQALAASRRAIAYMEQLAEAEPRMLPNLAAAVNNLGSQLVAVGQGEEAIAAFQRAIEIYEHLPDGDSSAGVLPNLAGSLTNLAAALAVRGRNLEALAPIRRAVTIFDRMAEAGIEPNDDDFSELGRTLANQAKVLADTGRFHDALTAAQQAVGVYERLAETRPDAWLPGLATSLTNLSGCFANIGRYDEALAAGGRAVGIQNRLAESLPDAHLPGLANALRSLSNTLAATGNYEKALTASRRAVAINERLAAANPGSHLPELASSLNALAGDLRSVGRLDEALNSSQRAVEIYDQLAQADPGPHMPGLAMSLVTLSALMNSDGLSEERLVASERAVAVYEQLAETNPPAYEADLARALNNLALSLSHEDRHEGALAAAERAVSLSWQLAAEFPDIHLPELAAHLVTMASMLSCVGRTSDAVAAIERAVELYQQAAAVNQAHLPDLALSLRNSSVHYGDARRVGDALAAIQRAASLYGSLATDRPERYLPEWATALHALSIRLDDTGQRDHAPERLRLGPPR